MDEQQPAVGFEGALHPQLTTLSRWHRSAAQCQTVPCSMKQIVGAWFDHMFHADLGLLWVRLHGHTARLPSSWANLIRVLLHVLDCLQCTQSLFYTPSK